MKMNGIRKSMSLRYCEIKKTVGEKGGSKKFGKGMGTCPFILIIRENRGHIPPCPSLINHLMNVFI